MACLKVLLSASSLFYIAWLTVSAMSTPLTNFNLYVLWAACLVRGNDITSHHFNPKEQHLHTTPTTQHRSIWQKPVVRKLSDLGKKLEIRKYSLKFYSLSQPPLISLSIRMSQFVAECVSTALHTETVLYIVQRYAQQRLQNQRRGDAGGANSSEFFDDYYDDGLASDAGSLNGGGGYGAPSGDAIYHILENMGVHSGLRLAERLLCREPLASFLPDVVGRFVAGPVWVSIFGKPMEILPSNEYDVVELRDANFRWIRSCSFKVFEQSATNTLFTAPGYGPDGTMLVDANPITNATSAQPTASSSSAPAKDGSTNKKDSAKGAQQSSLNDYDKGVDESGPADFVVYTCGILRGVLQTLGHPHAAVSFQVMAPSQQQSGASDSRASSLLNLADVRFTLDFRGERALLGR